MCVETTQSVSLVPVVCSPVVGVVCHHEVVLSELIATLVDSRSIVDFRDLRQAGCFKEVGILLRLEHTVQFGPEGGAHFCDLPLFIE